MTNWQTGAACSNSDPDWFGPFVEGEMAKHGGHAGSHPRIRSAFRVCAGCPVRMACLKAGLDGNEQGVWGGQYLSQHPRKRAQLRKQAAA